MSSDAEILPPPAGERAGPKNRSTSVDVPQVFAAAVEHALWFQVGVFGLAFLLMLALPARRGHNPPTPSV
jgi:hypothetical protein